MNPLAYLLPQPPCELSSHQQDEFEALFGSTAYGAWVDYQLAAPKWQFMSYLCQSRELVLHGTQNLEINVVEPRQAMDVRAFSNQKAIYATTDGIWVIYFAILNRLKFDRMSLFNSCLNIRVSPEQILGPLYFFSVTHSALIQDPWCDGAVYILPRENFVQEPGQHMFGMEIIFPHWISSLPAEPVAKLHVHPADFPFLADVHGHDDERLTQLATANPDGFPWPAALVTRSLEEK